MDPIIAAGMIFSIVVLAMIGSFILLFPVTRRLGRALEIWLEERQQTGGLRGDLVETQEVMGRVIRRIEAMEERQRFMERLLEEGAGPADRNESAHANDEAGRG